jgi:hypothetical protein
MHIAEHFAKPICGELGGSFARVNDFNHEFFLRWGKIDFELFHGAEINLKIILKVYSNHGICETYIVDTEPYDIEWNRHKRRTRDFYIHPFSETYGQVNCIKFSYIIHKHEYSINSEKEYIFMDWPQLQSDPNENQFRYISDEHATDNSYQT